MTSKQSSLIDMSKKRVFVFMEKRETGQRPYMHAIPEDRIVSLETIYGSQNVYLKVNGIEVQGSFDEMVAELGERIDVT